MGNKKTLSDNRILKRVEFGKSGDDCGWCYLEDDIKKIIKLLKNDIYEDDYLGWRNKRTLEHFSELIDKRLGGNFA